MDIEFACDKCGQHLVIDEAGASCTVQCPRCNASLTVPSPLPPLPSKPVTARRVRTTSSELESLTSQELWHISRDLVYDLRIEEAMRVSGMAGRARVKEKGYEPSSLFDNHDSARKLLEVAKWVVNRSLQTMTPEEEREITSAAICLDAGLAGGPDELLVVTLGTNIRWPSLEEWFHRFDKAKFWPRCWETYPVGSGTPATEFFERSLTQPTDRHLARMHDLSLAARRVLLDGWLGWGRPPTDKVSREAFDIAAEELISEGFAVRAKDLPPDEWLKALPISRVREIQRKHGVKGARSKEDIAKNLIAAVSIETLRDEATFDNTLKLNVDYRQIDRFWFEYSRAKLLEKTFFNMRVAYREYEQYQESKLDDIMPTKLRIESGPECSDEDCPFCSEACKRFAKLKTPRLEDVPPFHPGCTCWARAETE